MICVSGDKLKKPYWYTERKSNPHSTDLDQDNDLDYVHLYDVCDMWDIT